MVQKILFTHLCGMGDYLMARPSLMHIKEQNPNCFLAITIDEKAILSLIQKDSFVDKAFVLDTRKKLFFELYKFSPDVTYTSTCDIAWTWKLPVLTKALNVKYRIGSLQEKLSFLYHKKIKTVEGHCVIREANLAGLFDVNTIKTLYKKNNYISSAIRKNTRFDHPTLAVINPLTGRAKNTDRLIPLEIISSIINKVAKKKIRSSSDNINVIFIGTQSDANIYTEIINNTENLTKVKFHNLAGKTSIFEAAGYLENADCVLSADTGTMHLADMLETPVYALGLKEYSHRHYPFLNKKNFYLIKDVLSNEYIIRSIAEKLLHHLESENKN